MPLGKKGEEQRGELLLIFLEVGFRKAARAADSYGSKRCTVLQCALCKRGAFTWTLEFGKPHGGDGWLLSSEFFGRYILFSKLYLRTPTFPLAPPLTLRIFDFQSSWNFSLYPG